MFLMSQLTFDVNQTGVPPEHTRVLEPQGRLFYDQKKNYMILAQPPAANLGTFGELYIEVAWNKIKGTLTGERVKHKSVYWAKLGSSKESVQCPASWRVTVHNDKKQENFIIGVDANGTWFFSVK